MEDSGDSTKPQPQFRTSNTTHNFNLDTPMGDTEPGDDVCSMANLNPGDKQLFVLTVFSNAGTFQKTSILLYLISSLFTSHRRPADGRPSPAFPVNTGRPARRQLPIEALNLKELRV